MLLDLSRPLTILVFAVVIANYIRLIKINPKLWPAAAMVFVLAAHYILFYSVVLCLDADPSYYTNVWLNGLAIHTAGTLIYASIEMAQVFQARGKNVRM